MTTTYHFLSVVYAELKLTVYSEFSYRWQVLVWVISDIIQPIIFAVLWSAVATSGDSGITPSQVVSYYFMVMIVIRFTQDWSIQIVSDSIIRGSFSKYLLRPINYLSEMLGVNLGLRVMRVVLIAPFIAVGFFLMSDLLAYEVSAESLLLFCLAVIGGFLINFLLGNTFALLAIFIKQMQGMKALYINLVSILSGQYIPLAFLPVGLAVIFKLLPFRFIISFPIEIIMGSLNSDEIRNGFLFMALWLVILLILYILVFKISVKRYESEGL